MPKIPYFNFPMLSFIVQTALKPPPEIIKHLHATLCCPFHSSSYISFLTVSTLLHIDSIIFLYIFFIGRVKDWCDGPLETIAFQATTTKK